MYPQSLIVLQFSVQWLYGGPLGLGWLGITSISLMEHNYAVSATDWLATHNRQYLGRGNLTNNQSNQQLSTLQLAELWCKIMFPYGFIADGLGQIKGTKVFWSC